MSVKARTTNVKTKIIKIKRRINSRIRTFTIIFTMKRPREKRASTRKRKVKIIKSLINMLFVKRLYNIYAYKKTFSNLLKREQCDLNYVII